MNTEERYLLRITCPGRTGLVAAINVFRPTMNVSLPSSRSLTIFRQVDFFVVLNF